MPFAPELNNEQRIFYKRIFRKIFLEDWLMKLIALVITLALWLGVSGLRSSTTTRLRNITLNLQVPNNVEVTNAPVQEVDIVVSGDKRKIELLNPRDLVVSLDLTDVPAGEKLIQLAPENVTLTLPTGIKLEEIQPNKIAVKLENVEERDIPVQVETENAPAENYEVYSQTVLPAKIRVRGPASYVKSLSFISTDKIDLANRQEDFTARQVPVNVLNPKANALDTVADVVFRIGEKRVEKPFIVTVKEDKGNKKATVVLYGAHSMIEKVRPENLHVEIVKTETGEESLRLDLPSEIQGQIEIRKLKIQ